MRGNKCVFKWAFVFVEVFSFFLHGERDSGGKSGEERKRKGDYSFRLFCSTLLNLCLAGDGIGNVGLADGGLGRKDGDLRVFCLFKK